MVSEKITQSNDGRRRKGREEISIKNLPLTFETLILN